MTHVIESYDVIRQGIAFIGPEAGYLADCILDDLEAAGLVIVCADTPR